MFTKPSSQTLTSHTGSISIASWNCRGLHNSIPYIQHLFSLGVDILILQEHWLWPLQLGSINKNYSFVAVCDQRLSSTSNLSHGCDGTPILCKKCFHAAPLSKLNSDRICGIQLPLPLSHTLTILGVYMPSSDQPQEIYNSYVQAVDQVICQVSPSSPFIVAGDLNCHLGHLGGPTSSDCFNSRGLQWKELIDCHSLYVTSSNITTGPSHTYYSNGIATTLDYMIGNLTNSSLVTSCCTMEDHPLNTSDHLPIVSKLNVDLPLSVSPTSQLTLDWNRASNDGLVSSYVSLSNDLVKPLLAKDYSSNLKLTFAMYPSPLSLSHISLYQIRDLGYSPYKGCSFVHSAGVVVKPSDSRLSKGRSSLREEETM